MTGNYENRKFKQGYAYIVGCDEVGRGCLAGPVVAAAVVFDGLKIKDSSFAKDSKDKKELRMLGIDDSKLLTPKRREYLSEVIKQSCVAWAIGLVKHSVIDEINIHQASLMAMRRAVDNLSGVIPASEPESRPLDSWILKQVQDDTKVLVVIDGKFTIPNFPMYQEAIVDGDAKVFSIAAASIIAKVYRDNLMRELDNEYPNYRFGQHKGYATAVHRAAIKKFGLTPIHRLSFCSAYL